MFLGHFAVAAAAKPAAPKVPVWMLFVAAQLLDVLFLPLVALGVESITPSTYGQAVIHAPYTHSLVGALLISAGAYWLGKRFWKTATAAWMLAGLTFSHWLLDLPVHRQDMPLLPGGEPSGPSNLPLLGFGLWDYTWAIFGLELTMALVGLVVYALWARRAAQPGPGGSPGSAPRWLIGPIAVAAWFILSIVIDHPTL